MREMIIVALAASVIAAKSIPSMPDSAPIAVSSVAVEQSTAAVDELLAVDRAFSVASAKTDVISGLTAMFAPNVTMPAPGVLWLNGIDAITQNLRTNPDNATSHAEWTPIRGGISADGQHGFTFGFMTVHKADNTTVPIKYMSYWVKSDKGWRVAVYKRARRADSTTSLAMMPPSLPSRTVAPITNVQTIANQEASLKQAEQSFSDEAQKIGLGAAFIKTGSPDAVNMGSGPAYIVGADAIGRAVGDPEPKPGSPVVWNADRVIVASSGDLGITMGVIHNSANPTAPGSPFFTIWRRASPTAPWRYIAE